MTLRQQCLEWPLQNQWFSWAHCSHLPSLTVPRPSIWSFSNDKLTLVKNSVHWTGWVKGRSLDGCVIHGLLRSRLKWWHNFCWSISQICCFVLAICHPLCAIMINNNSNTILNDENPNHPSIHHNKQSWMKKWHDCLAPLTSTREKSQGPRLNCGERCSSSTILKATNHLSGENVRLTQTSAFELFGKAAIQHKQTVISHLSCLFRHCHCHWHFCISVLRLDQSLDVCWLLQWLIHASAGPASLNKQWLQIPIATSVARGDPVMKQAWMPQIATAKANAIPATDVTVPVVTMDAHTKMSVAVLSNIHHPRDGQAQTNWRPSWCHLKRMLVHTTVHKRKKSLLTNVEMFDTSSPSTETKMSDKKPLVEHELRVLEQHCLNLASQGPMSCVQHCCLFSS